ncbi:MAG: SIMPL domain-containing protein [bacterium]|nr:SIMPL domain-containing protein [bacterium]
MLAFYNDLAPAGKRAVRRLGLTFAVLVNVFVLALIFSYGFSAWREARGVFGTEKRLEVSVSGEGKVSAKPDVARITATVLTEADSLASAQEENSGKASAVTAYVKQQGVAEKDIKTVGYNIFPQYQYPAPCRADACPLDTGRPRIVGYQVRNTYEITVRDLAGANAILAGIVGAGVNEVGGIVFTIDKPDELKAEARRKAIEDARTKAVELAGDLGRRLGKITNFTEGGSVPPIFYARDAAFGKGGGGIEPSVQPGENEVIVTVSITYELR